MLRTPEPELMDDQDQVEAYAAADFSTTDAAFADRCVALMGAPARILDLGCGPGNIALQLAARLPDAHILGVDGAPRMLDVARQRASALGSSQLHFAHYLVGEPVPEPGTWDAIVSNSLLHHLHDPMTLWHTIRAAAGPGAHVFIGDLRRPATEAEVDTLVSLYAGDAPPVLQRDFRASLHAAFTPAEIEAQLAVAGLKGLVVEPVGDRHVHVRGRVTG
jgi:SAM-dependent methyltransferase